jgi:hypothetical protein
VSRDDPASEKEQAIRIENSTRAQFNTADIELRRGGSFPIGPPPADDDDAAEAEIKAVFQGKLMALRRLPRHERAPALRAAREWFLMAMKAAREKRARDRYGKYMQWRLQIPRPG